MSQGMYPTIIVILVHSKYSALEVHTVEGSVDLSSAGILSTHSRRTKSTATILELRGTVLEPRSDIPVDLYEMERVEVPERKEDSLVVKE